MRQCGPALAIEVERKFLVRDETWRKSVTHGERLRDGLIAVSNGNKVRVRLSERGATLTIKSPRQGDTRVEFEYEVPCCDAEEMLALFCGRYVLSKTRHYVIYEGFTWEIDVYDGVLAGVILAEVELERSDVDPPLPSWIGQEVTDDPAYKKINMLRARLALSDAPAPSGTVLGRLGKMLAGSLGLRRLGQRKYTGTIDGV